MLVPLEIISSLTLGPSAQAQAPDSADFSKQALLEFTGFLKGTTHEPVGSAGRLLGVAEKGSASINKVVVMVALFSSMVLLTQHVAQTTYAGVCELRAAASSRSMCSCRRTPPTVAPIRRIIIAAIITTKSHMGNMPHILLLLLAATASLKLPPSSVEDWIPGGGEFNWVELPGSIRLRDDVACSALVPALPG